MVQSCTKRTDIVFSAFDELHYIILFNENNDFELQYNGLNTATGTYTLTHDTIALTYSENQFNAFDPNEELTRKILINSPSKRVRSMDDARPFCATIDRDNRE